MSPPEFRRDPYLRTCGYDLLGWAPFNVLLSLPAAMALAVRPWPALMNELLLAATIASGFILMWANRRRAAKLMGPADRLAPGRRPSVSGATIWLAALALGALADSTLVGMGCRPMLLPLWMVAIGCGCVFRGRGRVPELTIFGMSAALAGLVSIGLVSARSADATGATTVIAATLVGWNAMMVVAAGITAVTINRRYAWR